MEAILITLVFPNYSIILPDSVKTISHRIAWLLRSRKAVWSRSISGLRPPPQSSSSLTLIHLN
jgi:hypothetical protein